MFRRPHHRRIARVLELLDADLLADHQCWFGGGTALALAYGEYRESVDIDFLISDRDGYLDLREIVAKQGIGGITTGGLEFTKEPMVDGSGVRTAVIVDGVAIKFEIVVDGYLEFESPPPTAEVCGVRQLTQVDQIATRLLANADRWPDRTTFARDLIDLSFFEANRETIRAGVAKAELSYRSAVRDGLSRSIGSLADNPKQLAESVKALQMDVPPAAVWSKIREFEKVVGDHVDPA